MGNTVGSCTKLQQSILIGSLLGDGYARIFAGRKDALLEINHSLKQKEYVDWKYAMLCDIAGSPPKARKSNGARMAYRFYTKQLPELTALHKKFYAKNKKRIPDGLVLDPMILGVWFMDDGSRCRDADVYLNTQQFDAREQQKLIDALGHVGLEAHLQKDKQYFRLRLMKTSVPKLRHLLKDIVIPSMQYKLYATP